MGLDKGSFFMIHDSWLGHFQAANSWVRNGHAFLLISFGNHRLSDHFAIAEVGEIVQLAKPPAGFRTNKDSSLKSTFDRIG